MSDLAKLAVGSVSDASRVGKSREKLCGYSVILSALTIQ